MKFSDLTGLSGRGTVTFSIRIMRAPGLAIGSAISRKVGNGITIIGRLIFTGILIRALFITTLRVVQVMDFTQASCFLPSEAKA